MNTCQIFIWQYDYVEFDFSGSRFGDWEGLKLSAFELPKEGGKAGWGGLFFGYNYRTDQEI